MTGEGKYDAACTKAREATEADSVILIVLNGNQGHGTSVQSYDMTFPAKVPRLLRKMADAIEKEVAAEGN